MAEQSNSGAAEERAVKVLRLRPFWWGVINVLIAVAVLFVEPESIANAVDDYSYAVFGKTVGGPIYRGKSTDDIGVVLLDDESLAGLKSSWPAVYGLHAEVLRKLLTAAPKAVFIDFTFRDRRTEAPPTGGEPGEWLPERYVRDDSLMMLVNTLQMYQMMGIPVYLQAGALNFYQHHAVLSELAPYVTLVAGWGDARGRADVRALTYPMFPELRNADDSYGASDVANLPLCDDARMRSTGNGNLRGCDVAGITAAAPTIYQHLCSKAERAASLERGWTCDESLLMPSKDDKAGWLTWKQDVRGRPMWLSWPDKKADYTSWTKAYDQQGNVVRPYECSQDSEQSAVMSSIRNLLALFGITQQPEVKCAPFQTISAEQVFRETPSAGRWVDNFEGRIVMYGQNLQGFQDIVRPPTIDVDIPGVFIHAMALENLLSNGKGYLSDRSTFSNWLNADIVEIATLVVILTLRFGLGWIARKSFPAIPPAKLVTEKECGLCEYVVGMCASKFAALMRMVRFLPSIPGAVFVWWTGKNSSSTGFDRESRQLARNWFMFGICVLDLVVSVVIVTFGAIVIEFWVLAIAPVNWMAVIGLGMLSYIPFVRSLFADEA
jgi:CHASE2 domain-containing sensor protein|tara:strand:+ start:2653 stop:4470 length:1818 start_codon:yes stop_codon:yes gene_type:complete